MEHKPVKHRLNAGPTSSVWANIGPSLIHCPAPTLLINPPATGPVAVGEIFQTE